MLFFVSVGMLLDPAFFIANLGTVLWVVALVAVAKMFIFGGITRVFGYRNVIPLASALRGGGDPERGDCRTRVARGGLSPDRAGGGARGRRAWRAGRAIA